MQRILTKREKLIFYFTAVIMVFGAGFNFLIIPVLNKYDSLNKEISISRAKLAKHLRLLSQKEGIQNKYSKFSSKFKFSAQQDAYLTVLSELENLAKNANIRIVDLRPQRAVGNKRAYSEILIDLRAEGDIAGYTRFIYDVENSLLLLKIKKFQLNAKPNTPALEGVFSILQISYAD